MRTTETSGSDHGTPAYDPRLQGLVSRGVIDESAAAAVTEALDLRFAGSSATGGAGVDADAANADTANEARRRPVLGEIAGYVGATFVVVGLVIMLSLQWDDLGLAGQVGVPALGAAVTWAAGVLLLRRRPQQLDEAMLRRLVSALVSAGAVLTGMTVLVWATSGFTQDDTRWGVTIGAGIAALLSALGYRIVPSAVGQLTLAGSLLVSASGVLALLDLADNDEIVAGAGLLAGGLLWLGAARRRVLREPVLADVLVGAALLSGSFTIAFEADAGSGQRWVGYGLMGAVAALGLLAYLRRRSWPLLLAGLVSLVTLTPTVLSDVTGGELGQWAVMLVAGGTLIAVSLVLLRTPTEPED